MLIRIKDVKEGIHPERKMRSLWEKVDRFEREQNRTIRNEKYSSLKLKLNG